MKIKTTLLMAAIAFSPLFVMQAASLTDLSQNYRPNIPSVDVDLDESVDVEVDTENEDNNNNRGESRSASASLTQMLRLDRDDLEDEGNRGAMVNFRSMINSQFTTGNDNNNGNGNNNNNGTSTGMIQARANATTTAFENASDRSILLRSTGVSTEEDLRAFALIALDEDKNINQIEFENDSIVVGYRGQGRFIGLLPVFMTVDVIVDQEGDVEFDYPWYGFLMTKNGYAELETKIEAEIQATLSDRIAGGWTNADRAELAAIVISALRAYYEANTATSTATSTSGV